MDSGRAFLAGTGDDFMARHGHLCRGEIELANPRWAEQPDLGFWTCLAAIRRTPKRPILISVERFRPAGVKSRSPIALNGLNPFKRWIFSWVVPKGTTGQSDS